MGQPISWAKGLPLRADGFETEFYKKSWIHDFLYYHQVFVIPNIYKKQLITMVFIQNVEDNTLEPSVL